MTAAAWVLVLLQFLLQLQAADATLKTVWRLLVLSFDNPATQALDELACEKTPCADTKRDVLTVARIAAAASSRAELHQSELLPPRVDVSFGITRAPPLA